MLDWLIGSALLELFPFFVGYRLRFRLHFCFSTKDDHYAHWQAGVGRVWSVCFREVSIFKVRRFWSKNGVRSLWGISSYSVDGSSRCNCAVYFLVVFCDWRTRDYITRLMCPAGARRTLCLIFQSSYLVSWWHAWPIYRYLPRDFFSRIYHSSFSSCCLRWIGANSVGDFPPVIWNFP